MVKVKDYQFHIFLYISSNQAAYTNYYFIQQSKLAHIGFWPYDLFQRAQELLRFVKFRLKRSFLLPFFPIQRISK
jgi:hypothetical protein